MGPEWVQKRSRMTPESTLPDWSPDVPQIPDIDLPTMALPTAVSNKALFNVLLAIAEEIQVSSKDWIRPPT